MTDYKKDFPLLAESDIAYLDNAATEQRPACVLDAEREFYERWNANPLRGLYELGVEATEQYEHARERVARSVSYTHLRCGLCRSRAGASGSWWS